MKLVPMRCDACGEVTEWAIDSNFGHDHCPECGSIEGEPYDEEKELRQAELDDYRRQVEAAEAAFDNEVNRRIDERKER